MKTKKIKQILSEGDRSRSSYLHLVDSDQLDFQDNSELLRLKHLINTASISSITAFIGISQAAQRKNIIFILGGHGTRFISLIIEALADIHPYVRREAICALSRIGSEAIEALPALKNTILHDPDAYTRIIAAAALKKIDPESKL